MSEEQLSIRVMLRNELSGPLRRVRRELADATRDIERSNRSTTRTTDEAAAAAKRHEEALRRVQRQASSSWSVAHTNIEKLTTRLNSASTAALGLAWSLTKTVVTASVAGAAAVTAFGIKSAASIENLTTSINVIFGPDEGKRLFSQLQQLANYSPMTLTQVASGAKTLAGFGVAADQIMDLTKAMSDVASASTDPAQAFNSIALALGQINASGRVGGQEILQLVNAGVPALDLLASTYGKTTAEIKDMQNAGVTFPADAFLKAFANLNGPLAKFQGLSQAQSKTLLGTWSTFTDQLQQKLATSFAPVSDVIKEQLPGVGDQLGTVFDQIAPPLAKLVEQLLKLGVALLPMLGTLGGPVLGAASQMLTALTPYIMQMAKDSPQLASGFADLMQELIPMAPQIGELLVQIIPLLSEFTRFGAEVLPVVIPPVLSLISGLVELINKSDATRDAVFFLIAGVLAFRTISTVIGAISLMATTIKGVAAAADAARISMMLFNATAATSGNAAALAGIAGKAAPFVKGGALLGGAGLGAYGVYEGAKTDNTAGSALGLIGGSAAVGATIGSVVPGIGTLAGGAVGAAAGGIAFGAKQYLGDVGSNLAHSVAGHNAASAATPGAQTITSSVRGFGLDPGGSDHPTGRAVDVTGSNLQTYSQNVRNMGGYATVHDRGFGRHAHAVFGDETSRPRSSGSGGGGGYDGPPVIVYANVSSNVDMEQALNDGLDKRERRKAERG